MLLREHVGRVRDGLVQRSRSSRSFRAVLLREHGGRVRGDPSSRPGTDALSMSASRDRKFTDAAGDPSPRRSPQRVPLRTCASSASRRVDGKPPAPPRCPPPILDLASANP